MELIIGNILTEKTITITTDLTLKDYKEYFKTKIKAPYTFRDFTFTKKEWFKTKYDRTKLYTFKHRNGAIEKDIKVIDMAKKYNIPLEGLYSIVNGKLKNSRGWFLYDYIERLKEQYYRNKENVL